MKKCISILLVSICLLASCGKSNSQSYSENHSNEGTIDKKPEGIKISSDDPDLLQKLDLGGVTQKELEGNLKIFVDGCMANKGWVFSTKGVIPTLRSDWERPNHPPNKDKGYKVVEGLLDQAYNLDIPSALAEGRKPKTIHEEKEFYGVEYSSTLTGDSLEKFQRDLNGDGEEPGGCIHEGLQKFMVNISSNAYVDRVKEKMYKSIGADKDLAAVQSLWSACVAKEGWADISSRNALQLLINKKGQAIIGELKPLEETEPRLMALLPEELQMAAADLKCSAETSYDVVMQETYKKYGLVAAEELGYLR
jgi:hypothetical protein